MLVVKRTSTLETLGRVLETLALLSFIVLAQGLSALDLLRQKEQEVEEVASLVRRNAGSCDLIEDCSQLNCSRLACYRYATTESELMCQKISTSNANCGTNISCFWKNFDYKRSVVRLVVKDQTSARSICMQRNLDEKFKTMSNQTHFFRVFYGSVDGSLRIFPGMDEGCPREIPYDPRTRPWYLQSTYVQKGVVVLVDTGPSMYTEFNAGKKGETYASKAKDFLLKFLDTLWVKDYINVYFFNGDNPYILPLLNDTFMQVDVSAVDGRPLLRTLRKSISGQEFGAHGGLQDPTVTDARKAINEAIKKLTDNSTIPPGYLKVIILLLASSRINKTFTETEIQNSTVNIFAYKLRATEAIEVEECTNKTKSFEEIPVENIDNPLYALKSYYSFQAKIRIEHGGDTIEYSQQHQDYSSVDPTTFTLSKAVIGPSNELLGVVGLDIYMNKMGEQFGIEETSIIEAANTRNRLRPPSEYNDKEIATKVCFNHTDPCESFKNVIIEGEGICIPTLKIEDLSVLKQLSCCGNCTYKIERDWSAKLIAGVTAAGVAGAVGLVLLVTGCWYSIYFQNPWMIFSFKINSSNEIPSNEENRSLAQTASPVDPQNKFQKES